MLWDPQPLSQDGEGGQDPHPSPPMHSNLQSPCRDGRGVQRRKRVGMKPPPNPAQNSTLQAGKVSSCMATVLLLPSTVMPNSCCLSWVSWYHSCITSESKVGINVT